MTREDAIEKLQKQKAEYLEEWVDYSGVAEAFDMAIEALTHEETHETHNAREEKMKHRGRFTGRQIADLVMHLNGEVEPVGETNTDDEKYDSLIRLQGVVNILLYEICKCSEYSDRAEFSMRRSGEVATVYLEGIRDWIIDNFGERRSDETD